MQQIQKKRSQNKHIEWHHLESLLLKANQSQKLCNANGIKAMNHILIQSQKKEHLNQEQEKGFIELPSGTKQIK